MGTGDVPLAGEVGYGAGDFENAGIRAGAQTQALHGVFQELFTGCVELTMRADIPAGHLGITEDIAL